MAGMPARYGGLSYFNNPSEVDAISSNVVPLSNYRRKVAGMTGGGGDEGFDEIGRQERLELLNQIRQRTQMLDDVIQQGRKRFNLEQRSLEDAEVQKGIERDRANRDAGAANVSRSPAEYLMPAGKTQVPGVAGTYKTQEGGFSNFGVLPGRSYGELEEERKVSRQKELLGIKNMTAGQKAIIESIKANEKAMADPLTPKETRDSLQQRNDELYSRLDTAERVKMGRGGQTGEESTTPKGYRSVIAGMDSTGVAQPVKTADESGTYLSQALSRLAQAGTPEAVSILDRAVKARVSSGDLSPEQGQRWAEAMRIKAGGKGPVVRGKVMAQPSSMNPAAAIAPQTSTAQSSPAQMLTQQEIPTPVQEAEGTTAFGTESIPSKINRGVVGLLADKNRRTMLINGYRQAEREGNTGRMEIFRKQIIAEFPQTARFLGVQ